MFSKYPLIFIPNELNKFINSKKQEIERVSILPMEPKVPLLNKPEKEEKNESNHVGLIIFGWTIFCVLLIPFSIGWETVFSIAWIFIVPIYLISTYQILIFFMAISEDVKQKTEKEFNRKINLYNSQIEKYNKELVNYKNQFDLHKKINELPKSKQEYLIKEIYNFISKQNHLEIGGDDKRSNSGVSEKVFLLHLIDRFRDKIGFRKKVASKGTTLYPDFILHVEQLNLFIDIEIDEPYIGFNGKPIHFLGSKDSYRNVFFNKNKWIVIRFAEIQVIMFPEKCCDVIETVIDSLINQTQLDFDLKTVDIWTKDDAYEMAFKRSRNDYLPQKLQDEISVEKFDVEYANDINLEPSDDLPF